MNKNIKILISIIIALFLNISFSWRNSLFSFGLKDFKNDFNNSRKKADKPETEKQEEAKEDEEETSETKTEKDTTNSKEQVVVQSNTFVQATPAKEAPEGKLKDFYKDFKPEEKKTEDDGDSNGTSSNGSTYDYYYGHYTPGYYRWHFPYFYPYHMFYPAAAIIVQERKYEPVQKKQEKEPPLGAEPISHTWFNTSLDYRRISDNLSSIGMIISIVSAKRTDEISYGFKLDYDLLTEKVGSDHYSLPLYYIGVVMGKQLGKGLVEAFFSYCALEDLGGLSLKFSTEQWIRKHVFVSGGIAASVINNSPLTDLYAGIGFGNSTLQFTVNYRSQNSVNYDLTGPEFKLGIIF